MTDNSYSNEYQNSWALVVGIDTYKDPRLPPLGTAVKGARAFADLLREQFTFSPDRVILLENEQATQGAIRRAFTDPLGRLEKTGKDDRVIIYFGGHGVTYDTAEGDIGCVAVYDTELAYWDTAIPMDELTRLANRSHAKHVLFLLDACFSGYATTRASETGSQRQLNDYMVRPARQVIAAGTRDQAVSDMWGPDGQSLFTGFLLEGLRGAAPAPGGLLRVYHLAGYLQDVVGQNSKSRQTPQYASLMGSQGGDFVFAVRPIADLTTGMLAAVKSENPADRVAAVGQLRLMVQSGSPEQADKAFGLLQELTNDPDEMVCASARGALRALLPQTNIAPVMREKLRASPPRPPTAQGAAGRQIYGVLTITSSEAQGWRFEIDEPAMSMGRSPDNSFSFPSDQKQSRVHARLEARDGKVWLADQNSTNGTYVNETRLTEPQALKEGDAVRIGDTVFAFALAAPVAKKSQDPTMVDSSRSLGSQVREANAALQAEKAAPPTEPEIAGPQFITADNVAKLKATARLKGHTQSVSGLSWSPDGERLATGSLDKTVMTWDITGKQLTTYEGHTSVVSDVIWSPDAVRLASASWDSTVSIWDSLSGRRLRVLKGEGSMTCVGWSLDGATLVGGSRKGNITVWDSSSGERQHDLQAHTNVVHDLAWSSDGVWLASGAADKIILIWDMFSNEWTKSLEGHGADVQCLAWSPDCKQIVSGSIDGEIIQWDVPTAKLARKFEGSMGQVLCIDWSYAPNLLATGHDNGSIMIWDAATGKRLKVLDVHHQAVTRVAWSHDGLRLASASLDGRVIIWEVADGK